MFVIGACPCVCVLCVFVCIAIGFVYVWANLWQWLCVYRTSTEWTKLHFGLIYHLLFLFCQTLKYQCQEFDFNFWSSYLRFNAISIIFYIIFNCFSFTTWNKISILMKYMQESVYRDIDTDNYKHILFKSTALNNVLYVILPLNSSIQIFAIVLWLENDCFSIRLLFLKKS